MVTIAWILFWIAGLPDYYQQYSMKFMTIFDDPFHYGEESSPAKRALAAARKLGIPTAPICIQRPIVESMPGHGQEKGGSVIGGGAMFRGRAVEKLVSGLPRRSRHELIVCPREELRSPSRVLVDCYGHVASMPRLEHGEHVATPAFSTGTRLRCR